MKECPTGTTVYTYYFDYETHELICESPHPEGRGGFQADLVKN